MMSSQQANRHEEKPARLLFIDDEPRVLASMKATFRQRYQIVTATGGREALELLSEEPVDVVISDQRMPGMTGVETLTEIRHRHPKITRILLTGYADLEAVEASINECEVFRYLMKPCPSDELSAVIEQALAATREASPQAGRLIEFPVSRRQGPADPVTQASNALPPGDAERRSTTGAAVAKAHSRTSVLALSRDNDLLKMIRATTGGGVHKAIDLDAALTVINAEEIGVIVIDAETVSSNLEATAARLKTAQPSSVLLVASPRGDATLLINLINTGDIYRFLLKPVASGQCRLWLDSAIRQHQHKASQNTDEAASGPTSGFGWMQWLRKCWRSFTGTAS